MLEIEVGLICIVLFFMTRHIQKKNRIDSSKLGLFLLIPLACVILSTTWDLSNNGNEGGSIVAAFAISALLGLISLLNLYVPDNLFMLVGYDRTYEPNRRIIFNRYFSFGKAYKHFSEECNLNRGKTEDIEFCLYDIQKSQLLFSYIDDSVLEIIVEKLTLQAGQVSLLYHLRDNPQLLIRSPTNKALNFSRLISSWTSKQDT